MFHQLASESQATPPHPLHPLHGNLATSPSVCASFCQLCSQLMCFRSGPVTLLTLKLQVLAGGAHTDLSSAACEGQRPKSVEPHLTNHKSDRG